MSDRMLPDVLYLTEKPIGLGAGAQPRRITFAEALDMLVSLYGDEPHDEIVDALRDKAQQMKD